MVYTKLTYLACIACLCHVSQAQSLRRVRPACVPRVVPRAPAPASHPDAGLGSRYRYECNVEEIISKLVNALIYTALHKDGHHGSGGGTGGTGGGTGGTGGTGGGTGGTGGGTGGTGGTGGGTGGTGGGTGGTGGGTGGTGGTDGGTGGTGGGNGGGIKGLLDALIQLDLDVGGNDVLDLDVLRGFTGSGGGGGGGGEGVRSNSRRRLSVLDLGLLGNNLLELLLF